MADERSLTVTDHLYACTLSPAELAEAAGQYARAAAMYHGTVAYADDGALVTLHGDKGFLAALLDEMIAREGACCSHLQFVVAEAQGGFDIRLHVDGDPELAGAILRQTVSVLFPGAAEARS
ncbi:MAG TPA: hypothetical protein VMM78_00945 [Thermomicrobiales bacterium]|nr:hypothetical protein [Thermomicrobiales bacterium]